MRAHEDVGGQELLNVAHRGKADYGAARAQEVYLDVVFKPLHVKDIVDEDADNLVVALHKDRAVGRYRFL